MTKAILEAYGIDMKIDEEVYMVCMIYVVCKTLNIGLVYPSYLLLTMKWDAYTLWDALSVESTESQVALANTLVDAIIKDDSHITRKVKRSIGFLKKYNSIKSKFPYSLNMMEDKYGFTSVEYRDAIGVSRSINLSLKQIEELSPPRIFEQKVFLTHKYQGNTIELNKLSSGERQFVFTLSAVIYHLTNLISVKEENTKYRYFTIVLDELEICLHPDYQRMFVSRMLNVLTKLGFNKDPYRLNIILCTHSPFSLSDIPQQNILYMDEGKDVSSAMNQKTFGANINELLAESFFLSDGFMGEFASKKINSLARYLLGKQSGEEWSKEKASETIELIGDDVIRNQLRQLFANRFSQDSENYKNWLIDECKRMGISYETNKN